MISLGRNGRKDDINMSDEILELAVFVQTSFLAPTEHRGSRVKAKHLLSGKILIQSWENDYKDEQFENHFRVAKALIESINPDLKCKFFGGYDGSGFMWGFV